MTNIEFTDAIKLKYDTLSFNKNITDIDNY